MTRRKRPEWEERVEEMAAVKPPRPEWDANPVPWCSRRCPHRDGKRCDLTFLPADGICEPVVGVLAQIARDAMEGRK